MTRFIRLFEVLIILLFAHTTSLWAQHRTINEAQALAREFYEQQISPLHTTRGEAADLLWVQPISRSTEESLFYAFTTKNAGFVIVSADERAYPILGYASEGYFCYTQLPAPLQVLLQDYERQLSELSKQDKETNSPYASYPITNQFEKSVEPLLGNIRWNQDQPFNEQCPIDPTTSKATPAGCVAIAAAQIMKYHEYPPQGIGKRSYTTSTNGIAISATYEGTCYHWEQMLDDYNHGYNAEQAAAVAQLCYHVGTACRTDYCYEGSGATAKDIALALKQNFGYDDNLEYIDRTYFTEPDWEALLRTELDAGRPILHFGEGPEGGHAFVCDGYNRLGMFHYNWGWGGMSDGYFHSSALSPSMLGIGSGAGNYNYLQSALTQIQPPTEHSSHVAHLHLSKALIPGASHILLGQETKVTAAFYNCGLRSFTGEAAIALYKENHEEPIHILTSKKLTRIPELTGGTSGSAFKFTIPDTLTNGTYHLYLVHKEENTIEYVKMRAPVNHPNYLVLTKYDTYATINKPTFSSKLSLVAKPKPTSALYHNRKATFSITVRNDGEEFYSYLGILLQKRNSTELIRQYVGVMLTRIPKGTTRTLTYSTDAIEVEAGAYDIVAVCDSTNNTANYLTPIGPDELMVTEATIKTEPFLAENFILTDEVTIKNDKGSSFIEAGQIFTISAPLTNKGGYADGKFSALIFNRSGEMIGNSNIAELSLETNEKKELQIAHRLNEAVGQYGIILASVSGINATEIYPSQYNRSTFWLIAASNVNSPNQENEICLWGTQKKIHIEAPYSIIQIRISDLAGRGVHLANIYDTSTTIDTHSWPAQTYVVEVITTYGTSTYKVHAGQ